MEGLAVQGFVLTDGHTAVLWVWVGQLKVDIYNAGRMKFVEYIFKNS